MRMRGISLPVNAVIIIALAVMVLLMLAAFFGAGSSNINKATLDLAWNKCCSTIQTVYHCNTTAGAINLSDINPGYDIDNDGDTENCEEICQIKFGLTADRETCICACPGCCT